MPILDIRDASFFYETAGDPDAPPLLIITGITDYTAKAAWQMAGLAADFRVITFDNRGAGRSSPIPVGYTTADMADDAAAVLSALNIDSADVFGLSMGGMIALNLALKHPERVRRLVLGCTSAGGALWVRSDDRVLAAFTDPTTSDDPRQEYYSRMWMSISDGFIAERPDVIERLADMAVANPQTPEAFISQLQAILSHDVAGRLSDIRQPALVLHGDADQLIPPDNGRHLARGLPNAELILYPGAGHLFFIERADEVNREIRRFLTAKPDRFRPE